MQGLRALLRGEGLVRPSGKPDSAELRPIAKDLRALIRDIEAEHRSRDHDQLAWTPETLRAILHGELRGQEVIVVSNREPYIHVRQGDDIVVRRPASGLVTALEPIMRACSGTWIAHGSGSADREVVDRHDRVAVPADRPAYQLRRVWLTAEEEAGYYYGFANEGLWPLCHIAHVRPTFRTSDWEQYVKVNRRFADAVVQESQSPDPIVLVQDYHFALLPRMIREALPAATIITFWHIPWPNPEAFAICPWREELLDGLLGSSILGFHTQFHCNNFVDTVDRLLEARVDRETFTVSYRGTLTAVKRYPISIEWPPSEAWCTSPSSSAAWRSAQRHDLPPDHAIGVGRRPARLHQGHRGTASGRGTPARDAAGMGRQVHVHPDRRADARQHRRVSGLRGRGCGAGGAHQRRFAQAAYPPIILKVEHHEPQAVYEYYRAAELCFVSSLHDGMNLVAKEFVASRDDERGVLLLSQFTGAARELPEAIIVNPYDTDQCATALHLALSMPAGEQRARMRLMRGLIQEFNVYRWAGRMLIDAAGMRRRSRLLDRSARWTGRRPPPLDGTGQRGMRRSTGPARPRRLRSRTACRCPAAVGLLLRHRRHPGRLRRFAAGVRIDRELRRLLERLYRSTDGAVALISGRSIADIDRLFPGIRLPAAGQHGIERRDAAGRVVRHAFPSERLDGVRRQLADVVARHPGLLLEDKGLSLALHYRRVAAARRLRPSAGAVAAGPARRRVLRADRQARRGDRSPPAGTRGSRCWSSCRSNPSAGARPSSSATT